MCEGEGGQSHLSRTISSPMGCGSTENIWTAAGDGDIERVLALLTQDTTRLNAQDENGYSPL